MTCAKQEFCIHEKYCQRHIGQNFDSCILFSRNSKPKTNEEYLKSLDPEQLAEFLADKYNEVVDTVLSDASCIIDDADQDDYWYRKVDIVEWLKKPHDVE